MGTAMTCRSHSPGAVELREIIAQCGALPLIMDFFFSFLGKEKNRPIESGKVQYKFGLREQSDLKDGSFGRGGDRGCLKREYR